jgi:hypothetical protein
MNDIIGGNGNNGGGGGGGNGREPPPYVQQRPPPAPIATKGPMAPPPPMRPGALPPTSSGPSGRQSQNQDFGGAYEQKSRRPEMRGPSADVSDMMSRLKTKTINIQEAQQQGNDSTISISDLKDLQAEGSVPKKSKRRQKSDKNTVSLDI